jgi:hypothetical protein
MTESKKILQRNLKMLALSRNTHQVLKDLSKSKSIKTDGIDGFLKILQTEDVALLQLFAKSKAYISFKEKCDELPKIKSLIVLTARLAKIKPLAIFDRFLEYPENYNPLVFEEYSRFTDYFSSQPLENVTKLKLTSGLVELSPGLFFIGLSSSRGIVFGSTEQNLDLAESLNASDSEYFLYLDTLRAGGPQGEHFEPVRNTTIAGDWSDISTHIKKHLKI